MRSFVYTVISRGDDVIIAKKFQRWNNVSNGEILHYSGQYVFPGGGLNFNENPIDGAKRELSEETGISFNDEVISNYELEISDAIDFIPTLDRDFGCYALYVTCHKLEDLANKINENLSDSSRKDKIDGELEKVEIMKKANAHESFRNICAVDQDCENSASQPRDWFIRMLQ
ncbi:MULTISPECIES: NUDIX hydrolase [Bacteroides]|jgi:8-oxo-dGTP pyrophosphatase MutT (NUDIX family)|uniref:Nudix hydrolase domain-containing protein n=1 Tax=Bacteroides fragilis TaxID=817 RepID=A0A0I9SDA1_BACFG|nr:NUDIX domain-containing protein [Bacteroides fragilis]MCM0195956.1 NUDIX hydrolase [Bacteroides fragilis]MCM0199756.1 NUDIX hydrolase [Bacteroides fragilis]MCM0211343.1 NUDIX hydrolase [Bacteroides fragilis]MCM0214615.1 NUDIX hydrolase [Bacteroides fragilis]MCM0226938.1 NUDIX hydrolase [Bacteroides fragilis]